MAIASPARTMFTKNGSGCESSPRHSRDCVRGSCQCALGVYALLGESWAGDRTGVDGVTHVLVNRRAEALNRRESGLDRGLEIAGLI